MASSAAAPSSDHEAGGSGSSEGSSGPTAVPPGAEHAALSQNIQDGFLYTAAPALVSGATQAILFNPLDRALYVRVKFRRKHFLDKRNFERPFQGFMNAAVYRTLVGASYMFWQDSMRIAIERYAPAKCQAAASPQLNSMLIGLSAGSVNGFALNTLQAVKFRMWNTDERGITFARTALTMYREGGLPIFFRGCITTMVRDSVFGVVYETTRRAAAWRLFFERQVQLCSSLLAGSSPGEASVQVAEGAAPLSLTINGGEMLPAAGNTGDHAPGAAAAVAVAVREDDSDAAAVRSEHFGLAIFLSNLVAALAASMMSSPFNYVRSIVYGTPAGAIPLGYMPLLKSFYTQFYYIYRHGKSYTDRHGMPELSETEHRTGGAGASASSTAARRPMIGRRAAGADGAPQQQQQQPPRRPSAASRVVLSVRGWADTHRHHPIAAWTWANSRLNIGWGSIRVGLGMAIGQSLFYMAQDLVRRDRHAKHQSE